jgi:hypothetical protein
LRSWGFQKKGPHKLCCTRPDDDVFVEVEGETKVTEDVTSKDDVIATVGKKTRASKDVDSVPTPELKLCSR